MPLASPSRPIASSTASNQLDWLTGEQPFSKRDGFIYWMGAEMYV
jgi:hypothetical protein